MKNVIIATKNSGKAREFRNFFKALPDNYQIITLNEITNLPEIIENGKTFTENATIKAQTIYQYTHQTVIADDSGLVVDALNGEPGIYSARYAKDHDDQANMTKLLQKIAPVPANKRSAHFITALVAIGPKGKMVQIGKVDGIIKLSPEGNNGFGYDPIFYYPPLKKTFAQMSAAEKNQISHRGIAMKKLILAWPKYINGEINENLNL